MMPRQIKGLKGHMKHRRNLCIVCGLSATGGKGGRFTERLQKTFVENVPGGEYYDKDDLSLPDGCCTLGQPKFFWDFRLKLHGEVWAKSCLDTNFQPIRKSFDHVTEAP